MSLSMSPISDSNGVLIGVAKIARDITARVSMEQSLFASSDKVRPSRSRKRRLGQPAWPTDAFAN